MSVKLSKEQLIEEICYHHKTDGINQMIRSQITRFVVEHGYTYLEIARALAFYHEVLERPVEKKFGIGIVPHIMDDARKYYKELEREERRRKLEAQKLVNSYNKQRKVVKVVPAERKLTGRTLINIEEIE